MVPNQLKGKDFEQLLMDAAKRHEREGGITMGRYGVQGLRLKDGVVLIPSLPDFEGVLADGRQFIIEAKAVQGASLSLQGDHFRVRQYAHLVKRAEFNVRTFLLIHFAARTLTNSIQHAMTVAVPVRRDMPFWQEYEAKDSCTLHRDTAQEIGQLVPWTAPKGCKKPLPDLISFLWPEAKAIRLSLFES